MLYIEFVWETHEAILQRCHMNVFDYFQGVPQRILNDNMKTAAIGRRENGQVDWNTKFLDFAQHYGFKPESISPEGPRQRAKWSDRWAILRAIFYQGLSFNNCFPKGFAFSPSDWRSITKFPATSLTTLCGLCRLPT